MKPWYLSIKKIFKQQIFRQSISNMQTCSTSYTEFALTRLLRLVRMCLLCCRHLGVGNQTLDAGRGVILICYIMLHSGKTKRHFVDELLVTFVMARTAMSVIMIMNAMHTMEDQSVADIHTCYIVKHCNNVPCKVNLPALVNEFVIFHHCSNCSMSMLKHNVLNPELVCRR